MTFRSLLITVAVLGTIFQIGHFVEHLTQMLMWFVHPSAAYMSPLAATLAKWLGVWSTSGDCSPVTMAVGMEALHLLGNAIFLNTLMAYFLLTESELVFKAFLVELAHLGEHMLLTITIYNTGQAYGFSNLFGHAAQVFGHDGAVGYRVAFHFVMNLIPTVMLMRYITTRKSAPDFWMVEA